MPDVYLCDAIRTPIGWHGGALSAVRAEHIAAILTAAPMAHDPGHVGLAVSVGRGLAVLPERV
ncbi:hypothetical protein OCH239_00510 [Roseivivax halodurans JCM 10272]|uniref:Thiolase N-terminal domain-containing protein n=1 Tax=Roseivivax halodurans JCM 10272 TaxID=1449350 RepID=X7EKT4_9RHOB|nr:hypothetical protein [Roseivivax halodurans]ETX16709.1 hypothetical protein OCH239_00510 [Roseivivax halodurans JCM 10272]